MAGEVVALLVGAGLVGRNDVELVLNRAGARQGLPVAQAAGRKSTAMSSSASLRMNSGKRTS